MNSIQLSASLPIALFAVLLFGLYRLQSKGYSFNVRVLLALVLGILLGGIIQLSFGSSLSPAVQLSNQAFRLIGTAYFALLKMLVIPLVLTSIVHSILNLGDMAGQLIRDLALRSVLMLLSMTAIASLIGVTIGLWFHVGRGLAIPSTLLESGSHPSQANLVDTLLGMLPINPIAIMTHENTVAIVIFAVLLGVSALLLYKTDRAKAEPFKQFFSSAFYISKQLASLVIALTPYGVLAVMAHVTSTQGVHALLGIINYIGAMFVAMAIVIVMHLLIVAFAGINPIDYLKRAYSPLLVAFITRSSFGTLPVTEETLRDRFQTRQMTSTFVPSIGATLGMNACAGIFPAMLVVMAMTILHQPITPTVVLTIMFTNAIASLGISGIPGTAMVAATVTLSALGLPNAVIGLVQGVDAIVDMGRTATNVNGVMTTAVVVDKSLREVQTS